MPKKNAPAAAPDEDLIPEPTDEEIAEWEAERRRQEEKRLAPYRAFAQAEKDQDDLLAELLFKDTLRDLEA